MGKQGFSGSGIVCVCVCVFFIKDLLSIFVERTSFQIETKKSYIDYMWMLKYWGKQKRARRLFCLLNGRLEPYFSSFSLLAYGGV